MDSQTEPRPTSQVYWAAKDGFDLADEAYRRVRDFYNQLPKTVAYERWQRAYRVFFGLSGQGDPFDVSKASATGDQGELTAIKVNHAGSIARRSAALVSQVIPEFDPIANNDDYKSLAQVLLCKKLLNYYMDTRGVGACLYQTALASVIFGEARLEVAWDPGAGQPLKAPDPVVPARKKTGDLSFRVFTPLDLVIDRFRYDNAHDWIITRSFVNKWDLAARYPGQAEDILSTRPEAFPAALAPSNSIEWERSQSRGSTGTDLIPLFTLYHRKSDALPDGRWAIFLNDNILLASGALPYDEVPLVPIAPGNILRTPYGDTMFQHILALQEVYDVLASSVATNNIQTATQIILIPDTCEYSFKEITEGSAVLKYTPDPQGKNKPEALVLTGDNGQALKLMSELVQAMEMIGGISSTLRGAPQANITSGAFGALVAQQALEYASAFQYSFQRAVGLTGDFIVRILKRYADQPIVAEIAGEARRYQVREFKKSDLELVQRVTVKSGNPAARTAQFNLAAADSLLQRGVIDNPKDYLSLARTGDLDVQVEAEEMELMNIRRENELLSRGQRPVVIITDCHREHIKHHKAVVADPSARDNPLVVRATTEHLQEHLEVLRTADPQLLMIIGETPLGQPGQPGPQPGAPAALPGAQPGPAPAPPPVGGPGKLPGPPNLPNNPLTGRTWTPQDGAIAP